MLIGTRAAPVVASRAEAWIGTTGSTLSIYRQGRLSRGGVDWNSAYETDQAAARVASHAEAWIGTCV